MLRFTIRDVLWLTVVMVVGAVASWINFWLDYQNFHLRVQAAGQGKLIDQLTKENGRLKERFETSKPATLIEP